MNDQNTISGTINASGAVDQFNKGNQHLVERQFEKAVFCYREALKINPHYIEALNNLGIACQKLNRLDTALSCFIKIVRQAPEYANAYGNMGNVFEANGRPERASACYQKALSINPGYKDARVNLGRLHEGNDHPDLAYDCYQKALRTSPESIDALFGAGTSLQKMMQHDESLAYFKKALDIQPDFPQAKAYYHLSLPIIYDSQQQIDRARNRFKKKLDELIQQTALDTPDQKKDALTLVGSFVNFYLQYQGRNDKNLQATYGRFLCRIMQANYPKWSTPVNMPPIHKNGKIRIGIVSSYMHVHSVGKFIYGWIKNIRRDQFEVYGYYLKKKEDWMTEQYQDSCDRFYMTGPDIEAAAGHIASDNLHLLIYTDIGMFPPASMLAGLRLAPIQCVTGGHPITTGHPVIDYYLSTDLMEPENGQDHYTEKMIRLSNTALCQEMDTLPQSMKTRTDFHIREDAFVYLSSQSLFKYLPKHDYIFPSIASEVPGSTFVFISNPSPFVTGSFKKRLKACFEAYDLDMDEFCIFLPRLGKNDFLIINYLSDVLLDPMAWSGNNTSMEGISCGPPVVVTCPGEFMRSRHTYAHLMLMGVTDTIACDKADYIRLAVKLAHDKAFYDRVKQKIKLNRHKIYNDRATVHSLEHFIKKAVHEHNDLLKQSY